MNVFNILKQETKDKIWKFSSLLFLIRTHLAKFSDIFLMRSTYGDNMKCLFKVSIFPSSAVENLQNALKRQPAKWLNVGNGESNNFETSPKNP